MLFFFPHRLQFGDYSFTFCHLTYLASRKSPGFRYGERGDHKPQRIILTPRTPTKPSRTVFSALLRKGVGFVVIGKVPLGIYVICRCQFMVLEQEMAIVIILAFIAHYTPNISHVISLLVLTLNIPSLAHQRCLSSWGPRRTPCFFFFLFFVISQMFDAVDYSNYVFWVSETIIQ